MNQTNHGPGSTSRVTNQTNHGLPSTTSVTNHSNQSPQLTSLVKNLIINGPPSTSSALTTTTTRLPLPVCLLPCLSLCLCRCPFVCLSFLLLICLSCAFPPACLSVCQAGLSVFLFLCFTDSSRVSIPLVYFRVMVQLFQGFKSMPERMCFIVSQFQLFALKRLS